MIKIIKYFVTSSTCIFLFNRRQLTCSITSYFNWILGWWCRRSIYPSWSNKQHSRANTTFIRKHLLSLLMVSLAALFVLRYLKMKRHLAQQLHLIFVTKIPCKRHILITLFLLYAWLLLLSFSVPGFLKKIGRLV